MDTLVEGYANSTNGFEYNHHSIPAILEHGYDLNHGSEGTQETSQGPVATRTNSEGNSPEEGDFFDACLKYMSQMLMEEEDLEHKPCMLHHCLALQAAERSLYDLLGNNDPPIDNPYLLDQNPKNPDDNFRGTLSSGSSNESFPCDWIRDPTEFDSSFGSSSHYEYPNESVFPSFGSSNSVHGTFDGATATLVSPYQVPNSYNTFQPSSLVSTYQAPNSYTTIQPSSENFAVYDLALKEMSFEAVSEQEKGNSPNESRGKKNHYREDSDYAELGRSNKQLASTYADESAEESKMFDEVLLCHDLNPHVHREAEPDKFQQKKQTQSSPVGRPRGKKKNGNIKEVVDLRTLLTQCAQAVSSSDTRTANDLLNRIRQHSSQHGDGTERLAYYFANALEARLARTGTSLYTAFETSGVSAAEILKAYQVHIAACPFKKMSYFFSNRSITKLAKNSTTLHIIDFGILYGFQWPCLIQRLSIRAEGPPKLRITGIDLPQPGFRPAERVEDTGRRLARYCKRFNVPFEFNAIAKKWHTIQLEDLKINRGEVLVVNSLYRLKNIPDDTVSMNSPRDSVLNMIEKIKPDMFIHGVTNGTFNAPFFVTRFREALFHFSSFFDMFDATIPREDQRRLLLEKEAYARDAMNVIACEGTERVERPETYKQWQARNVRAGLRQVALNREILQDMKRKVKSDYHRDFVVDEDNNWILQGWKGRILHALSCWKPVQEL